MEKSNYRTVGNICTTMGLNESYRHLNNKKQAYYNFVVIVARTCIIYAYIILYITFDKLFSIVSSHAFHFNILCSTKMKCTIK